MTIVAYLVTSHRLPEQVLRLVKTLRALSPAAPVIVHHDGDRPWDLPGGVLAVPRHPVEWAWAPQLDMLLGCLRFALRHVEFDWLTILSGQDYPARPLEAVERGLATSGFDGYVEGHRVRAPPWSREAGDEFARRYFYAYRRVPDPGRLGRRAIVAARPLLSLRDLPSGVLVGRRVRTPFGPALPCRRGSDWMTMSRRCVQILDRAARERPRLLAHFRRTPHPTEAFPHTVLHAEPGLRLSGDVRRHTRWDPGGRHPAVLGEADLDAILASGTDFARKFDHTVDSRVLDALDRAIGRSGA